VAVAAIREERAKQWLRLVLLACGVLGLYAILWRAVTGDMRTFLIPWLDHILDHGPISAFAIPFSNYTPPYLYLLALVSPVAAVLSKVSLIKALSVAGTLFLAFSVRHLLRSAGGSRDTEAMLWVFALPSVAANAADMGQCDAIWSAACVFAVAAAVSRRPLAMVVWFGIALAFKAQAVFLGPFVALQLIQQRARLTLWGIPALPYVLAILPAALAGWPLADLATIYLRQVEWNPALASTAANPWSLIQYLAPQSAPGWYWLGIVAAAGAALTYVAAFRKRENNAADLVALALLSACILPFLLPKMLERFSFLADVLAFTLAFLRQDRRSALIFWLVQGASLLALAGVVLSAPLVPVVGSLMMFAAILLLVRDLRGRGASEVVNHANAEGGGWQTRAAA
jgi:Gpi18-like mannosyltransferase